MRAVQHIDGNPRNNELSNLRMVDMPHHTPGPWQIGASTMGKNGTARTIWRDDQGPGCPEDSPITGYAVIARDVHNEADANLIINSLKMLTALKTACAFLEEELERREQSGDTDYIQDAKEALEECLEVINAAEGK